MKTCFSPWQALQADTVRQYGKYRFKSLVKGAIGNRTFRPLVTLRLCQMVSQSNAITKLSLPLFKVMHGLAVNNAGIDLAWRTKLGAGAAITHGWGLVVNLGATIGHNVTLFHGVTLGRKDKIGPNGERVSGLPTIEDEVWIGPNAVIVGGITIGRGSRIAAGAFVVKDIPPYSVVVGNPAKIVRENCTPDVNNPAPLNLPQPETTSSEEPEASATEEPAVEEKSPS